VGAEPGRIRPEAVLARYPQFPSGGRFVDVRSRAEFAGERVPGFESVPLDELKGGRFEVGGPEVVLLCQGGGRATRAAQQLQALGVRCVVVEGGVQGWKAAGLPVEHGGGRMLPVMQQTQLVLGVLAVVGSALAIWKDPRFAWIPLFLGSGLILAGSTGWCGLALLLARMPWNRRGGEVLRGSGPGQRPGTGASCCGGGPNGQ
jgi:rhodanese-related sulfurtransferase